MNYFFVLHFFKIHVFIALILNFHSFIFIAELLNHLFFNLLIFKYLKVLNFNYQLAIFLLKEIINIFYNLLSQILHLLTPLLEFNYLIQ
jgi:hypothetical protein